MHEKRHYWLKLLELPQHCLYWRGHTRPSRQEQTILVKHQTSEVIKHRRCPPQEGWSPNLLPQGTGGTVKRTVSVFGDGRQYTAEEFELKTGMSDRGIPTIDDIKISEQGMRKLMENLSPNKAGGPDGISPQVLRTC